MGESWRPPSWKPPFEPSPKGILRVGQMGPYRCRQCGCEIYMPGICDECGERMRLKAAEDRLAAARNSIPRDFQCMKFGTDVLNTACGSPLRVGIGRKIVDTLMCCDQHLVLLDGDTGTGKTSLACAMLQYLIDNSPMGPGCRFVFAPRIARAYSDAPKGCQPEILQTCFRARVLLIDDLGQDAIYRDNLRTVIQTRDADRLPTIITTFLTESDMAAAYGGGISRRLFCRSVRVSTCSNQARPGTDATCVDGQAAVVVRPMLSLAGSGQAKGRSG